MSLVGNEKNASAASFTGSGARIKQLLLRDQNSRRIHAADELVGRDEDGVFEDERLIGRVG